MRAWLPILLCVTAAASAQGPLERAEVAYRAGDYEAAQAAWREAIDGRPDGRIEYNLGNCAYRLGDHARALWRYERARRQLGDRPEVLFNRSLALRRLGTPDAQTSGIAASVRERVRRWGPGAWFLLAVPLEILGLLILASALRRRRTLLAGLGSLLVLAGIGTFVLAARIDSDRLIGAIVLAPRTALRSEPRTELPALVTLAAGVRAELRGQSRDWVRVQVGEREGWLPRSAVGLY